MLTFIMIMLILACVLLVLIILAQNPKGGGLSPTFGGGMSNPVLGARKTADFLEKATWYIGSAILLVVLVSSSFLPAPQEQEIRQPRLEGHPYGAMHDREPSQQQPGQQPQQPGQQPQQPGEGPGDEPDIDFELED